ncbi:MAG: glycosyltransferase [Verrucomicrobiae bacterium]|nr:glycosyltransferase [Verrucomicrobiae bacterium]
METTLVSSPDLRPSLLGVLEGMAQDGLLSRVLTTLVLRNRSGVGRWLRLMAPEKWRGKLEKRFAPDFLEDRVEGYPWRELARLAAGYVGGAEWSHQTWLWAELGFDRWVARSLRSEDRCVYGMEHASLETFRAMRAKNGRCILRAVMAHGDAVDAVLSREIGKPSHAASAYEKRWLRDQARVLERKRAECELAGLIIANSDFVRQTYLAAGLPPERVVAVPTGCPPVEGEAARAGAGKDKLIFLFAGTLSLRKGMMDLLAAWERWDGRKQAELWLAGSEEVTLDRERYSGWGVRFLGRLGSAEMDRVYRQADVFVLPTHLEGLAYVVLEAIAHGLPVVTTEASGCGKLVEDGVNGRIVRPGQVELLVEVLEGCLAQRGRLPEMGRISREKAKGWTQADSQRAHHAAIREFLRRE